MINCLIKLFDKNDNDDDRCRWVGFCDMLVGWWFERLWMIIWFGGYGEVKCLGME